MADITIARHDERIHAVEERQDAHDHRIGRIEDKLNQIYFWLVGVAGGVAVALVLLLLNVVFLRT